MVDQEKMAAIASEVKGIVQQAVHDARLVSRELSRSAVNQVNAQAVAVRTERATQKSH